MAINYPAGGAKNLTSQMSLCIRPTLRQDSLQDSAAGSVCVSFCASVVMCFRVLSMWNLRCMCASRFCVSARICNYVYSICVCVLCLFVSHVIKPVCLLSLVWSFSVITLFCHGHTVIHVYIPYRRRTDPSLWQVCCGSSCPCLDGPLFIKVKHQHH